MIYDVRIYNLKSGKLQEYMDAVREISLPLRRKNGVKLAGWYYTDIGPSNQVIHIWAYESYAHMEKAREAIEADPIWTEKYVPLVEPLIESGADQIMKPADFFPGPKD